MGVTASGGRTAGALAPGSKPPLAVPRRLLRLRSDAALAERFALGDEAAFDVLYERYRPAVLSVCMGILGGAHDAEDVTQETFSALAIALRGNPPQELRPWLARVARNRAIDVTRRGRQRALTRDGELPEIAAQQHTGKAELAVVFDGIRELPESQRTALLMRELGGHSYADIAALLETHEDAVRGLIARARVGLRSYREATQLPCAAARASIEAEPDGRRHNRAVRRHLRGCAACRAYRAALRDDARALRAILPIEGGITGGGMLGGGLAASKGMLVGAGLTQASAVCAASVCAAGAVGGIVLIAPLRQMPAPMPVLAAHRQSHQVQPVAKPVEVSRSVPAARPRNLTATPSGPRRAATVNIPATYVIHSRATHHRGGAGDEHVASSRAVLSHHHGGSRSHGSRPAAVSTAQRSHRIHQQAGPMRHEALPTRHEGALTRHQSAPTRHHGAPTPHQNAPTRNLATSTPVTAPAQTPAPATAQSPTPTSLQTSAVASHGEASGNHTGWTGDHSSSDRHSGWTGNAGSDHGNGNAGLTQATNGEGTASGHVRSASGQAGLAVGSPHTSTGSESQGAQSATSNSGATYGSTNSTDGSGATQQTSARHHVGRTNRFERRVSGAVNDGSQAAKHSYTTATSQTGSGYQNGIPSQTSTGSKTESTDQSQAVTGTVTTSPTDTGSQKGNGSQKDNGSPTDTTPAQSTTDPQSSSPTTTTGSQTITSPSS